jgi:hypothetical protein
LYTSLGMEVVARTHVLSMFGAVSDPLAANT